MADYQSKTGRYSVKRTLSDEAKAKLAKARELALVRKKEIKAEKLAPPPEDPPPDPPEPVTEPEAPEPEPVPEKPKTKKLTPDTDDEEVHVAKPKKLAEEPVAVKKSKKKKSKIVISNDTSSSDSDDDTPVIYIRSKKKNKKPAKKEVLEESEDLPPPVNYQLHKKLDLPAYEPPPMERQAPMGITRPSWMSW